MERKGQLTVEFLFVFIFLLLMVSILFTISDNFTENQVKIHLRNQETKIANSLAKVISSTKAFESADSYEVQYRIPKIFVFEKLVVMPCDIRIEQNNIRVEVGYEAETITRNLAVNLDNPQISYPLDLKCGDTLRIRKT